MLCTPCVLCVKSFKVILTLRNNKIRTVTSTKLASKSITLEMGS